MSIKDNPRKPYKAYASAVVTGISSFVTAWVSDTAPFTDKEFASAAVAAVVLGGASLGIVFKITNPKTST